MAPNASKLASVASILALTPSVFAGFDASASDNVVVYWGQNSAGQAGSQDRLSSYCESGNGIDVIPISFLYGINTLAVNFASASDSCTAATDGSGLLICPEIEEDIQTCQANGKTIMLSIGGATYSEGGFASADAATTAAQTVWNLFGSPTDTANRPFGSAVIDGFDLDLESTNSNFDAFSRELRSLMDADTSKSYYLSGAPQCPYPDAALGYVLSSDISFDFINIQFYNNYCGVVDYSSGNFNFETWDTWATTESANPNVKVLVGVLGASQVSGGYVDADTLSTIVSDVKQYASFGGVMVWDASQLFYNNDGYLAQIVSFLGESASATTTSKPTSTTMATSTRTSTATVTTTTATTATATSATATATSTLVPQYSQCGGVGYSGSTICQSPYVCTVIGAYWSQCE
ncbi:putative class III chitinase [Xylariaceae sp. FL1019]|nr:putative class III chitinase [Xylariaceae sp. FL1019]